MKIKVGDLTVKQVHSICQVACDECPLHFGAGENIECMCGYPEYDDCEVEIPDHILSEIKKETEEEEKWPIHNKNEALQMIIALADDYDNANSVEGLKSLIDELVEVAKAGMTK